jgi:LmbE family N-acetylglucosaminyl deacetylase
VASHKLIGLTPIIYRWSNESLPYDMEHRARFREIVKEVEPEPDAIFTHWPLDIHTDHRTLAELVIDMCVVSRNPKVCGELLFCEACPNERYPRSLNFSPTHWVDISTVVDKKKEMIMLNKSHEPERLWREHEVKWKKRKGTYPVFYNELFIRMQQPHPLPDWLGKFLKPIYYGNLAV